VDFTSGQLAYGRGSRPSPADGIVQAPGATAVLVANPADKAIYYYKEGMAAPMGHFQNYGREPRAVMVVDKSLEERAPGVYQTTAKLRRPGLYDVALFLDSPRIIHCFEVRVSPNPELAAKRAASKPVTIKPLIQDRVLEVGEPANLRFKLTDPVTAEPKNDLKDVQVLTILAPGVWQQRQWAEQVGNGLYEIAFVPPRPGVYYVSVEVRSLGLGFNKTRPVILRAKKPKEQTSAGIIGVATADPNERAQK
jgi:hypothetical protein